MKTYLTEEDKFNRILDQILVFHGYFPPWCAVFIIMSYAMYGRRTEAAGNMLVWFGLLNTIVAALVVLSLIMILMHIYSDGIKVKSRYDNDINQLILITKILCVGVPVILANVLMRLTTKYIGYLPLVNTFHQYFTFWLLGSMLTAWVDFKPVIITVQRIAKKMNLY